MDPCRALHQKPGVIFVLEELPGLRPGQFILFLKVFSEIMLCSWPILIATREKVNLQPFTPAPQGERLYWNVTLLWGDLWRRVPLANVLG